MTSLNGLTVTFRGVRGTVPVAAPGFLKYGGNTSCVELRCGERLVILDAGTGIGYVSDQQAITEADILLSHTHIDHIIGLTAFAPLFRENVQLRISAGHLLPQLRLEETLSRLISPPLFPLCFSDMNARITWNDFRAGEPLTHLQEYGIAITTTPLNHPDRATGYRITYNTKSICYLTDLEHVPGMIDPALAAFVQDVDLLIYDATYDDSQLAQFTGWGHSTWQQAVRLADAAGVKTLALFHHDPAADDAALDERMARLQSARPGSLIAREGLTLVF